jgi:hypothetical protein
MASEAIQRLQDAAKRARVKTAVAEQGVIRKVTIAGTGAGLGYWKKKGMPLEFLGVPSKLGLAGLATVVEIVAKGAVQRFAGAVSDAALAVYTHEAVEAGAVVAGETGVHGSEV